MRRTLTLGLALMLAACSSSSSGDTADPPTTSTTVAERTTTTLIPDEAFEADIAGNLDFGSDTPEAGAASALGLAQSICELLDTFTAATTADAPADTPETDASVLAQGTTMAIDTAFTGTSPPDVVAVVLRTGTEHLCPQHTDTVDADLERRGL